MEGGALRGVQGHLLRLRPDAEAGRLGAFSHPRLCVCWDGDICTDTEERGERERRTLHSHLNKQELKLAPECEPRLVQCVTGVTGLGGNHR